MIFIDRKKILKTCAGLLLFCMFATGLPTVVWGANTGSQVPDVKVPEIHVPKVDDLPEAKPASSNLSGESIGNLTQKKSLQEAKDAITKTVKMTLGSKKVLLEAVDQVNTSGSIQGSKTKVALDYAAKMTLPWIGNLPVENAKTTSESVDLGLKGIETVKTVSNALKYGSPVKPGTTKIMGASFPIIGGLVGIGGGSWEIYNSFRSDNLNPEHAKSGAFYSGVGEVATGAGMLTGGLAVALGAATAPALAATVSILLVAGLACSAVGFGLKHTPWFAESRPGRALTNIKNRIGRHFK